MAAAGIVKQVTDLLDAAAMPYVVYDETVPNPTDKNVHDGVEIFKKNKCDSLITLGGGSAVQIAVTDDDNTPEAVATKIAAGTFSGWTAKAEGAVVTFTKDAAGAVAAPVFLRSMP